MDREELDRECSDSDCEVEKKKKKSDDSRERMERDGRDEEDENNTIERSEEEGRVCVEWDVHGRERRRR